MAQAHLDRLSSIDAGFLHQEDGGAHIHIGGLGVFAGPPPSGDTYGLLADADAVPDLADLAEHLREALAELVDAARGAG